MFPNFGIGSTVYYFTLARKAKNFICQIRKLNSVTRDLQANMVGYYINEEVRLGNYYRYTFITKQLFSRLLEPRRHS